MVAVPKPGRGAGAVDADHPVGDGGMAVGVGKPAPAILDDDGPARLQAKRVAGAVGDAAAAVARGGGEDRLVSGRAAAGFRHEGQVPARRQGREVTDAENVGGVHPPGDAVGGDVPVVDDFADRGEDRPRIEGDAGRAAVRCSVRRVTPHDYPFKTLQRVAHGCPRGLSTEPWPIDCVSK